MTRDNPWSLFSQPATIPPFLDPSIGHVWNAQLEIKPNSDAYFMDREIICTECVCEWVYFTGDITGP